MVVLLSDGVDSHSVLGMEDVLAKARRSQALVYWLRLPYSDRANEDGKPLPTLRSTWRTPEEYWRDYRLLEEIVAEMNRVGIMKALDSRTPIERLSGGERLAESGLVDRHGALSFVRRLHARGDRQSEIRVEYRKNYQNE